MNANTVILRTEVKDLEHFNLQLETFNLTNDALERVEYIIENYSDRIAEMKLHYCRNYILVILEDCFAFELDHRGTRYENHPFNWSLKQKISKLS